MRLNIRNVSFALAFCLISAHGWAQQGDQQKKAQEQTDQQQKAQEQTDQQQQQGHQQKKDVKEPQDQQQQKKDRQQMRGLDEEVQGVKSDVLRISAELSQLEEKLLYPSGTEVALFVAVDKGDQMRLDAVRLQIDGKLVAHYIYSAKELEALRKGGVQRLYVGNVATGDHQLEVIVDGKAQGGADFSRTDHFSFTKEVKPKLLELTLSGPDSGKPPIELGDW